MTMWKVTVDMNDQCPFFSVMTFELEAEDSEEAQALVMSFLEGHEEDYVGFAERLVTQKVKG